MNINKVVIDEDKESHVVIAKTLSEAADATEKLEERCDEIRTMMKGVKIYKK